MNNEIEAMKRKIENKNPLTNAEKHRLSYLLKVINTEDRKNFMEWMKKTEYPHKQNNLENDKSYDYFQEMQEVVKKIVREENILTASIVILTVQTHFIDFLFFYDKGLGRLYADEVKSMVDMVIEKNTEGD